MKSKLKLIALIVIACNFISITSCSDNNDNNYLSNAIGSKLEYGKDKKLSSFLIPKEESNLSDTTTSLMIYLENPTSLEKQRFFALTRLIGNHFEIKMEIPENETIVDGKYNLSCVVMSDFEFITRVRYVVEMEKEMVKILQAIPKYEGLSGSGSSDDPYIISSTKDFDYLLYNISEVDTELHGSGSYFSQTADFDAPAAGIDADGREYASFPFAGNYNGNGYKISNINYTGNLSSSIDTRIGLFDGLLDGSKISNLKLDVSFKGIYDYSGALAGYTDGNVTLDNITATGDIDQCLEMCGGLIGVNQTTNGTLTITNCLIDVDIKAEDSSSHIGGIIGVSYSKTIIKDCKIGGDISGNVYVGGVIGMANNGPYEIKNISNADSHFAISGSTCIGGIIGHYSGYAFKVENINLKHTVTSADSQIKIISGSGDNTGGVFGEINIYSNFSDICYLKNATISCPIRGNKNVGGLIGKLYTTVDNTISIQNCDVTSVVYGNLYTGGLIGQADSRCNLNFVEKSGIMISEGVSEIKGGHYTGGIFGKYKQSGKLTFENGATVYCGVNISGKNNVGGFAGSTLLNKDKPEEYRTFNFKNIELKNTIEITGTRNVGGLIGYAENTIISGQNAFNYNEGSAIVIPKFSIFTPNFSGKLIAADSSSGSCIGGAVGKAYNSSINGICVNSVMNFNNLDSIGGIVGHIDSNIYSLRLLECCTFNGELYGHKNVGGIAGIKTKDGQIRDCINYGKVSANENVGGVLGKLCYESIYDSNTFVYYCVNTGIVTGSGSDTGGVVGYMQGNNDLNKYSYISHCGNYGNVTGKDTGVGGILGRCNTRRGKVHSCANHGAVHSSASCRTGGIVGSMGKDPGGLQAHQSTNLQVGYCANTGPVSSDGGGSHTGGILGFQEEGCSDYTDQDSWVHDCYNTGKIGGSGDRGGIVGYVDHYSYVQKCFNTGETDKGICGTRKNSAIIYDDYTYYTKGSASGKWFGDKKISDDDLKKKETFMNKEQTEGFDFNSIWKMGDNHPILQNCPFQDVTYTNQ